MSTPDAPTARRIHRRRLAASVVLVGLAVLGALLLVIGNAHLVYVAITSEPDCLTHKTTGEGALRAESLSAASPSC